MVVEFPQPMVSVRCRMNFLIALRFDSKDGCMGHQLDGGKKLGEVYFWLFFLFLVFLLFFFCAMDLTMIV
jgi:hypothetical protein